jgi:major capsid protein Gp23
MMGFKGSSVYDAGFFYATSNCSYPPYIPLQTYAVAKPRKLKAEWTIESAQDLKATNGLDAEAELSNILGAEIRNEIDREIIRTLYYLVEEESIPDTPNTDEWWTIADIVQEVPKPSTWACFELIKRTHDHHRPLVGRRQEKPETAYVPGLWT